MSFSSINDCDLNILVCTRNLDFVWTRVVVGCYRVKMKLYFHSKKGIIFTVVPFVDNLSHLERGQYNVVDNFVQSLCLLR